MWVRCFFISWVILMCVSCSFQKEQRVLVIHSYEDSYAAYPDFNKLIAKEFRKRGVQAEICTFYLDCEKYEEKPEIERMQRYLDSIAVWKPEVILVNEDQATYSLLKTYHPLIKQVPIVFAGVNYPNWELIREYPNVTGFHDKIDIMANIQVVQELSEENKSMIFTILDATFLDRKIRADLAKQLEGSQIFFCNDSITRTEQRQKIDEGYIIFKTLAVRARQNGAGFLWNLSKFGESPYIQMKRDFTTINVSALASNYCFSAINASFGYGENILGGYMTTMPIQVEESVGAVVQILKGKKPSELPITESRKAYVVDWKVMAEKGVAKESIPGRYSIINMPFYERYPVLTAVGGGSGVILLLLLFSWIVFLYRREANRRWQVLKELEAEREALSLAIQGGNTYAWRLKKGMLEIENVFWETLGREPRLLTIDEFTIFIHPEDLQEFKKYDTCLADMGKYSVELRCDFTGNGYQWWEFRCSTMHSMSGEFVTTGLFMNIEGLKQRERELIEARELAEQAELKQSFLANMSHEIRTPLNAIVGFANILTTSDVLEETDRKQFIDIINTNSELLLKLINDILELSRIESGYMSLKNETCSVSDLVNEVYTTHQMLISSHLQFMLETGEKDLMVSADRGRLTQVLTNFINNAGKFTARGYIKLGYKYVAETNEIRIYVEDTGKGIGKSEQKIIFSRFYKQDEFAQGTGLGLSICKVIIERLNGRIELSSEIGKGSCFTIVLPCVKG